MRTIIWPICAPFDLMNSYWMRHLGSVHNIESLYLLLSIASSISTYHSVLRFVRRLIQTKPVRNRSSVRQTHISCPYPTLLGCHCVLRLLCLLPLSRRKKQTIGFYQTQATRKKKIKRLSGVLRKILYTSVEESPSNDRKSREILSSIRKAADGKIPKVRRELQL